MVLTFLATQACSGFMECALLFSRSYNYPTRQWSDSPHYLSGDSDCKSAGVAILKGGGGGNFTLD